MPIGAQQVSQHVGISRIALGVGAAIARPAGLDGVRVDRKDLMAGFDQGIDDQARGPFDGDGQGLAKGSECMPQLAQSLGVVADGQVLEHTALSVDDAHRVRAVGPIQADKNRIPHGQPPSVWVKTVRVGRHGGTLINWRSGWVSVALHPVARRGLPAPRVLQVSFGLSSSQRRGQSPRGHGSRLIPSVDLLGGVNAACTQNPRPEHGLTTACFAVVDNTLLGLTKGQRVVHNQARWTTLRCAPSGSFKEQEVAL